MFMNLLYLFLPMIIFLGIITSIQDIKQGKIRNKWIIIAVAYALLMNIFVLLYMMLTETPFRIEYYYEFLFSLGFMIFIAFIIWWVGLWTAGDAKLIIAYTALIPLSVFSLGYVKNFPAFTLLLNIFVPMFFVMGVFVLVKSKWKDKKAILKQISDPKMLFIFAAAIFGLMWVINFLFRFVTFLPANYFSMVFFLFIFLMILEKILPISFTKTIFLLAILRLMFDRSIFSFKFLMDFAIIFVTMIFLRFFIINLGAIVFSKNVHFDELKPRLILSQIPVKGKGSIEMVPFSQIDLLGYLTNKFKRKPVIKYDFSYGLSKENIEELKGLYKEKKIKFNTIRVFTTIPFAPFVFLGVLITLICHGNMIIYIRLLLSTI